MKGRLWCSALLLAFLVSMRAEMTPQSVSLAAQGFERIAERQGITVYRHRYAKLIRLAAEGRIAAPPAEVRRALLRYEKHGNTPSRLSESRLLSGGAGFLVVYQRIKLPMVSDRDYNLLVTWGGDQEGLWVHYRALPNQGIPPQDGVVRVTRHEGSWQLKPINGGRETWARFEMIVDLGGWLPMWLLRPEAAKAMPQLFMGVRRMCS